MKYRKVLCILCAVLAVLPLVSACGSDPSQPDSEGPKGKSYFSYFDTVSYVYSYAGDSAERFDELSAEASAILSEYNTLFDIYHEYTGVNNLCTVNRNAGGAPVPVDEKLIGFLEYAKELYTATNGEFNIMLGAVLRPWHDAREQAESDPAEAAVPDMALLGEKAKHTDLSLLEIDAENGTVRISDPEASVDVGAMGKGYAVEMAAQRLTDLGAESYVLNVGGNIRIIGARPDGTGWVTGIKDPSAPNERFALKLDIKDISCVTSGVYERYFTVNGVRYHHIIDKDTLFPSEYYSSLTVLTKDSGLADALSTALFSMSIDEGKAVLAALKEPCDAVWILPDGSIEYTPGVSAMLAK